jgi:hypothetical protein
LSNSNRERLAFKSWSFNSPDQLDPNCPEVEDTPIKEAFL